MAARFTGVSEREREIETEKETERASKMEVTVFSDLIRSDIPPPGLCSLSQKQVTRPATLKKSWESHKAGTTRSHSCHVPSRPHPKAKLHDSKYLICLVHLPAPGTDT